MKQVTTIKVFIGPARPAHDSTPAATGKLTDAEWRVLTGRIHSYMAECRKRRIREGREEAIEGIDFPSEGD